jgi:hypothetical protein
LDLAAHPVPLHKNSWTRDGAELELLTEKNINNFSNGSKNDQLIFFLETVGRLSIGNATLSGPKRWG